MRMTLKEVCDYIGVTRRAVQGYKKAGLVKPTEKNKYGHLLYDKSAINKIIEIKQYQDFGFSIKEIQNLQYLSKEQYSKLLENKLILMKSKLKCLTENIKKLTIFISEQK